jgi:hypothetical protein
MEFATLEELAGCFMVSYLNTSLLMSSEHYFV